MTDWTGICFYFDAGWCYHPDADKPMGCVGSANCEWYKARNNGKE